MRRTNVRSPARGPNILTKDYEEARVPIMGEVLCGLVPIFETNG
jgi:hypothetical protein